MIGTILGAGMGLAGTIASMNSQEKTMNDQWRLEQEKMALQAKYNKEQADYSQNAMDLAQQQRIAKSNGTYEAWHEENDKKKEETTKPDNTEKSV